MACLTIIPGVPNYKGNPMNALAIFVVRLIIGLLFGILLTRLFRPEWGIYHGAATGAVLVLLAYGMSFFRNKNS